MLLSFSNCRRSEADRIDQTRNPVLSTLFNRRMLLLLKGTYSTDNPLQFSETNNGTGNIYLDDQGDGGDRTFDLVGLPSAQNLPIFLDIGEVRISSKFTTGINNLTQIRDPAQSQKFWDFIANERRVFCTVPYSLETDSCTEDNGIQKANDFFSGVGAQYPSNDPSSETISCSNPEFFVECAARGFGPGTTLGRQYYYTGVYFRSILTGDQKSVV